MTKESSSRPGTEQNTTASTREGDGGKRSVLFLCQHGGAKSVIAASYFNRLMNEGSLPFVGTAAAAETPYDSVPAPVAGFLEEEGLLKDEFTPRSVEVGDVQRAEEIVTIGCELTSIDLSGSVVNRWSDVPMASEDLDGCAASIRKHVDELAQKLRDRT